MEEKVDVHKSIADVNLEESNSINLKELHESIEEITVTPDIYLFFTPPINQGSLNDEKKEYQSKINNDIYNEIMNDKIIFMSRQNALNRVASSLILDDNTHVGTIQNLEMDTRSLPGDDNCNYFKTKLKINDIKDGIGSNKDKIKKVRFNKVVSVGRAPQMQPKVIDTDHKNLSNLIQMYCYKCKKASMNYIDRKCHVCETSLLFQCKKCSSIYKKFIILQNHIKYECYKKRIFQCADCDYKSTSKIQLSKHIRNEHLVVVESQKCFECFECHRKYKVESNMRAHEKICNQAIIVQCKYCTFKTKFNGNLAIHMQLKHSELNSENKSIKCPDCGKRFKKLSDLHRHIISLCGEKLKFECDHCDCKVRRKYCLVKHIQQQHPQLFFKNKFL